MNVDETMALYEEALYKEAAPLIGAGVGAATADPKSRGRGAMYGAGLGLLAGGTLAVGGALVGGGASAFKNRGAFQSAGRAAEHAAHGMDAAAHAAHAAGPEVRKAYELLIGGRGDVHWAKREAAEIFAGHKIKSHHWEQAGKHFADHAHHHGAHRQAAEAAGHAGARGVASSNTGAGMGWVGGGVAGGATGGHLAKKDQAKNEKKASAAAIKVASIYGRAWELNEIDKVADSYDVEHLPEHYKEALYKEAIMGGLVKTVGNIGGMMAKGVTRAAQAIAPKAAKGVEQGAVSGAIRGGAARAANLMRKNKAMTGAVGLGTAGTLAGGSGFAAGRLSKKSAPRLQVRVRR